jgi:para-nitrobenzyl esterase
MSIARTAQGDVQGFVANGVLNFRNIPYAAPPVGALRFAPPAPPADRAGLRDATAHGPIAPQPPSRLRAAMGDFSRPQSEDCLTLTIATPAVTGRRPVIVWLHGGAYFTGAGSLDWYDGAHLARDGDAVFVGVNYRLGAFGFLHLPGVAEGNMALADMVAALRWVRANIAAFGGDPARVTVMGQSAGAHAIMLLLRLPETEGLFHRAILQSPPPPMAPHGTALATEYAEFTMTLLGATPQGMREVAAPALIDAQMQLARAIARFGHIAPPFMPISDTCADPAAFIAEAAAAAGARRIPLIIGTTRDEMAAFFAIDPGEPDPKRVAACFTEYAGDAAAIELYRRRRPGGSPAQLVGDLVTDHLFLFPSIALADAATSAGVEVWLYQFDWHPPASRFAACHCIELPFVFGTAWPDAAMLGGADPARMAALSSAMRAAWTGFAHGNPPDMVGLPWPAYRPESRLTMVFGSVLGVVGDPAGWAWRA